MKAETTVVVKADLSKTPDEKQPKPLIQCRQGTDQISSLCWWWRGMRSCDGRLPLGK